MKNKIIAVFTACCMICGAFSLSTVNIKDTDDNTIRANAAEDSERETRHGYVYCEDYGNSHRIRSFYLRELDSVSYYDGVVYNGDSTRDIDWIKCQRLEVDKGYIAVHIDDTGNDVVFEFENFGCYEYEDRIKISFEDMDFIIKLYVMLPPTTRPIITTTATTTTTTTEYPWWLYETTTYTTTTITTTTTTPVQDFRIIPSSVNMKIGDTNRLALIGATNPSDVAWTSEDTAIATVSENGTVTAKGKGSTMIYAVYNGNVAVCTVNISDNNNNTIQGDANGDDSVDIADATAIVQHMGNPDEYSLSEQGKINADIVNHGDGVTGADAVVIQLLEAKKIKQSDFPITMEQYNALLNE